MRRNSNSGRVMCPRSMQNMSFLEKLYGGISARRKFTRCLATIHVCYFGSLDVIKIYNVLTTLLFIWISGLPYSCSFAFQNLSLNAHMVMHSNPEFSNTFTWPHSFITDLFLIVNFRLLRSTFKKNIQSIDEWLVINEIHFLYILSMDTQIAYWKVMIYTCVHITYKLQVLLFRAEECNDGIANTNLKKCKEFIIKS